jgi:hypothetical protein
LALTLEQSTDEVFAGECGEPQTVTIVAELSGTADDIADAEWATLWYQWDETEDWVTMERVDDMTFMAVIEPSDYCCYQTTLFYGVDVYDRYERLMISGSGSLLLSYCIG